MDLTTNRAPKFSKVELLRKNSSSINAEVFLDCGLILTGDYIIVIEEIRESETSPLITRGRIFNLADISSYQTTK